MNIKKLVESDWSNKKSVAMEEAGNRRDFVKMKREWSAGDSNNLSNRTLWAPPWCKLKDRVQDEE